MGHSRDIPSSIMALSATVPCIACILILFIFCLVAIPCSSRGESTSGKKVICIENLSQEVACIDVHYSILLNEASVLNIDISN